MTVRAVVTDGSGQAVVRDVADPDVHPGEALVEVEATSLNRGELNRIRSAPAGWRPGWDFAGRVVRSSPEGPGEGARVVGILEGRAWAERVAVPATWLAELPPGLPPAQAAALPTAGLTALRMLRLGVGALGRRVAITGAAGGVGRFAVQLARLAGAHVTAIVGSSSRAEGLLELGADEVVTGFREAAGPYDLVLESAGGESLAHLATRLDAYGTLISFGNSSNQPTTLQDVRAFYLGGSRRIQAFTLFHGFPADPPNRDLRYLAGLVAGGSLDPQVEVEMPWTDMGAALSRLEDRSVRGKLVLTLGT
jgi:NADPH:quinone reductase-like Zn-dependent oxidoreductase